MPSGDTLALQPGSDISQGDHVGQVWKSRMAAYTFSIGALITMDFSTLNFGMVDRRFESEASSGNFERHYCVIFGRSISTCT